MQQMRVDRESWHYRYNVWVYGERRIEALSNGCPYFWMTVLACFLSPLFGIYYMVERLTSGIQEPEISVETIEKIVKIVLISLFGIGMILTGYGIGIGQLQLILLVYALVGGILGAIFGITFLALAINDWKDNRPNKEPKRPNIVIQSLKAKKNHYCPKLEYTN